MKKANLRSKRTRASETPSPSKSVVGVDNQHQSDDNRIHDLEKENAALKLEVEELKLKHGNDSPASSGKAQKLDDGALQKLHVLEEQVMDLKKKLNAQSQFSTQKQKTAGRQPEDVIQRLKAQKVQLLCKIKLDSVQFRLLKASLEKEVLQLKKDQRKNEYEIRKLLALNNRQKLVLQRKQEEASAATRRLNELIEFRKAAYQRSSGAKKDGSPGSQGVEIELKVAERVEEIRSDFELQMEEMAEEVRKYEEEAEMLRQENFRFLLQEKEVDCMARDTELKDLKEEVFKLSTMVNQMPLLRARPVHITKLQDGNRAGLFEADSETFNSVPSITKGGGCCSCSKKSLCKTSKCECRAAKGSCGERCGCTTSKCSNRKGLAKKDSSSIESVIAQEVVHSAVCGTSLTSPVKDHKTSQGTIRQPFSEIANVQDSKVEEETKKEKRSAHVVEEHPTMSVSNTDSVECPKVVAEKAATPPDMLRKLTRAMRSAIMK